MRLNSKLCLAAAALALLAPAAQAQDAYAGASVGLVTGDDGFDTISTTNVILVIGYNVIPNAGIEGEYSMTLIADEDAIVSGDKWTQNYASIFGRGVMPLGGGLNGFARAGWTSGTVEVTLGGVSADDDVSGFSFGAGVEFSTGSNFGGRAEVTFGALENDAGATLDTTTISAGGVLTF